MRRPAKCRGAAQRQTKIGFTVKQPPIGPAITATCVADAPAAVARGSAPRAMPGSSVVSVVCSERGGSDHKYNCKQARAHQAISGSIASAAVASRRSIGRCARSCTGGSGRPHARRPTRTGRGIDWVSRQSEVEDSASGRTSASSPPPPAFAATVLVARATIKRKRSVPAKGARSASSEVIEFSGL